MFKVSKLRVTLLVLVTCSFSLSINFFVNSLVSSSDDSRRVEKRVYHAVTKVVATAAPVRHGFQTETADTHKQDTQSNSREAHRSLQDNPKVVVVESQTDTTSTIPTTSDAPISTDTGYTSNRPALETPVTRWCPETPPRLEGPLAAMQQEVTPQELMAWYPGLEPGGRLRPTVCKPRERLAIIFPYRNRYAHLHILMNNLIPTLQRQQADVTFFVMEQAEPEIFNRGALLNVGFLEAVKAGDFDCFIFHDVDLIPLNDHNLYRCGSNPRHFAVSMNKFGYRLLYKGYFGGVVGFTKKQYQDVNGCSNVYFGWGAEDDDLLLRLQNKNYIMARYDTITARYDMLSHQRDAGNDNNPMRAALLNNALLRQDSEGLNTIKYQVNSISLERLYTWINVSLNMTEVLQSVPDSTLNVIKAEMEKTTLRPKPKRRKRRMSTCLLPPNWSGQVLLTLSLVTPGK